MAAGASGSSGELVAVPAWVGELERSPDVVPAPGDSRYWEADDQVHGHDTVLGLLHDGPDAAVRGARVLFNQSTRTLYGLWPLGRRVCGHPGITHGGMSALAVDEMCGQAYVAFFLKECGPGFTANLNINYKAPVPAETYCLITVTTEAVEGRKVWFNARVTDGPTGTLFLEARCLFVVARKDDGSMSGSASMQQIAGSA